MAYLHNSDVSVHGKLRSCNCLIDGRFVLKISDFGIQTLTTPADNVKDHHFYNSKLKQTFVIVIVNKHLQHIQKCSGLHRNCCH